LGRAARAPPRDEIDAHERLAARLKLPAYEWWVPMWRSSLAILEGRFADASALIERFSGAGDVNARLYAEIQGFVMMLARERITMALDPVERETGRPAEYAYRAGYAWILAVEGRGDEARAQIALAVGGLKDDMNRLAALAELTQALARLGEPGPAAQLHGLLAPYADRNIVNARGAAGYGSASHHLGVLAELLGRRAQAEAHYRDALRHNERLGAALWLARTRERYDALTRTDRSAGSTFSP
jgi:tetratricopeptide (TPR) repeat protein